MPEIIFVTGNPAKLRHAQEALNIHEIKIIQQKLDLIEPREPNPEKVVVEKAIQALKQLNQPLLVEDSGIFIRALNGFPMGLIHFVEETIGMKGIIKLMEGVEDRYAEFRQSLAYFAPEMKVPKVFSYVDANYAIANRIYPVEYDQGEFDKILIPLGETKPLGTFKPKWRAKRDVELNQETIHYRQFARWISNQK